MKIDIDWLYMKSSLMMAGTLILFALAIAISSWLYLAQHEDDAVKQHQAMVEANSNLFEVLEAKRLFNNYGEQYKDLVDQGIVGNEQRLEWVDAVKSQLEALKLPELFYKINPQKKFESPDIEQSEGIAVTKSQIELTFGVYHTEDLIHLLYEVEQQIAGAFHVESCKLTRIEKRFSFFKDNANMKAICNINWFTLHPKLALSDEL